MNAALSNSQIALTKLVVKDAIIKIVTSDSSRKETDECHKLRLEDVLVLMERITGKYWTLDEHDSVFIGHNLVSLNRIVVDRYTECYETFDLGKDIDSHDFTEFEELHFTPATSVLVKEIVTVIDSDYIRDTSSCPETGLSPGFGVDASVKDVINGTVSYLYARNINDQLERYPGRKPVRRLGTRDILDILALVGDIHWLFNSYDKTFYGYETSDLIKFVDSFAEDGISLSEEIEETSRGGSFGDYCVDSVVLKLIRGLLD